MRTILLVMFLGMALSVRAQSFSYIPGTQANLGYNYGQTPTPDDDFVLKLERRISTEKKYLYNGNVKGTVFARNGAKSKVLSLNFNLFLQAMFIFEENGDTLIMERNPNIEFVVAGTDLFYHSAPTGFFIMKCDVNEKVWLVSRKRLAIDEQAVLAQNTPRSGAPLSSDPRYNVMYYHRDTKRLPERFFFVDVERFYLVDKDKRVAIATRRAFIRAFPGHRSEIDNFVRTNAISFSDEGDLSRMYQYCLQLDGSGSVKIARADR